MERDVQAQNTVSIARIFWRTMALQLLMLVLFVVFRQLLQEHSVFYLAANTTRIGSSHLVNASLIQELLFFFFSLGLIHFIWGVVIVISCLPYFNMTTNDNLRTMIWSVIFFLHVTLVLALNAYYFPTSLLGYYRHTLLVEPAVILTLTGVLTVLLLLGLRVIHISLLLLAIIVAIISNSVLLKDKASYFSGKGTNIIFIGVDGLRPDHLNNQIKPGLTPVIDDLMSRSRVYDRVYTPQGRTYVAWMSILTGNYPKNHNARFNLSAPERVERPLSLVQKLKELNYFTSYAIDERRFNQIDETYGFNQTLGPKIGAADGLISSFADFPLVNLTLKTPLAKPFFPYLHLNRGYGKGYSGKEFNQAVLDALSMEHANFLSVHYCQLHWPFTSRDFIEPDKSEWSGNYNHYMYKKMLKKLDSQIGDFIAELKQKGILEDAILVFLSDHGEGFMLEKDRLIYGGEGSEPKLNLAAWGHGTNVMSQEQAHVVLSIARYKDGQSITKGQKVEGVFSLVDIAPTIAQQLNLDVGLEEYDGKPLPSDNSEVDKERFVYVESSLPVKSVNASFIDDNKVISEAGSYFEVREDGRAVIQTDIYDSLLARKQRSIYYKDWQLVMLPDYDKLVLIDINKESWDLVMPPLRGEVAGMLEHLCAHYQGDSGFDPNGFCH